jgi:hypothetical protein
MCQPTIAKLSSNNNDYKGRSCRDSYQAGWLAGSQTTPKLAPTKQTKSSLLLKLQWFASISVNSQLDALLNVEFVVEM